MIDVKQSLIIIAVIAIVTALLRFLPFIIFSKGTPKAVIYLGKVLPYALMAMLLVYCLRNVEILASPHGLPELISVVLVVILHKWKHNSLISILSGTVAYMLLLHIF